MTFQRHFPSLRNCCLRQAAQRTTLRHASQLVKTMDKKDQGRLVRTYFERLTAADYPGILTLFEPDGWVDSPFLGKVPAAEFFARLGKASSRNILTVHDVLLARTGTAPRRISNMTGPWQAVTRSCFRESIISGSDRREDSRRCRFSTTPIRHATMWAINMAEALTCTAPNLPTMRRPASASDGSMVEYHVFESPKSFESVSLKYRVAQASSHCRQNWRDQ